jgi:hypothetical protein
VLYRVIIKSKSCSICAATTHAIDEFSKRLVGDKTTVLERKLLNKIMISQVDIKYVSLFMSVHIFLDFGLGLFNASPVFGTLKEPVLSLSLSKFVGFLLPNL